MIEDLEINDEPFTFDEFRKVMSSLQLGKAAGPDNVPLRYSRLVILTKSAWSSATQR
jgi:hypothetical protein